MTTKDVLRCLWDYGLVHEAAVLSILAHGTKADSQPRLEHVFGHTIDISEYLDFAIWDLVWYWDQAKQADMSDSQHILGHWLGIAHCVGSKMVYWILTPHCKVIA
jgi:hypothetical protein